MTPRRRQLPVFVVAAAVGALTLSVVAIVAVASRSIPSASAGLAANPNLDPGTSLYQPAADFTLTDQFGHRVSLHSYRGKVVLLAFTDSRCTTVCPLTTAAMVDAKRLLGAEGSRVQLIGVNANPLATSVSAVRAYSQAHEMMGLWRFLTGSRPQLERVWRAWHIEDRIVRGQVDHTPALFVIGPGGVKRKVYLTQMSYTTVEQLGELLAREAASLLPGHPAVGTKLSYQPLPLLTPSMDVTLPRPGGGTLRLGPGKSPRLNLFFDTWDSETSNLAGQLEALDRYQRQASSRHLPMLVAIDEGTVEPSAAALPRFLHALARPLSYPVVIDRTGQVADGYEVQDEPWLTLTSASGKLLWYYDPSTAGWPSLATLDRELRAALSRPRKVSADAAARLMLAGSAPVLAALHRQAGQLLGGNSAFADRVRALRGYPIVVNVWASWCPPCGAEFGLFASASLQYGRHVAFLGADTEDSSASAAAFLRQHTVSYPSYQTTSAGLSDYAIIEGLPTTFFVSPAGKVVYVHTGQYATQGTLDEDIHNYALR
jgi:cytochrome oxidase Cu insertion factor (SCO1/SenC/PrrC family)/thiol-disulfide isomerase/thioredoxin